MVSRFRRSISVYSLGPIRDKAVFATIQYGVMGLTLMLSSARPTTAVAQVASPPASDVTPSPQYARGTPSRLFDPPTPLVPIRQRSDSDYDQMESATRYTLARLFYQRRDYPGALRQYQRSFRLNPGATDILSEIVPLAFELEWPEVAARYAALADGQDSIPPTLLRQLALFLTEMGQHEEAIRVYELILAKDRERNQPRNRVFVHFELGRLHFLAANYGKSATSFEIVNAALKEPDKYGLSAAMRKLLVGNAGATYSIMAESFIRAGRPLGAESLLKAAYADKPNEPLLFFHRARVAEAQGDKTGALRELDQYFEAKVTTAAAEPYALLKRLCQAAGGEPAPRSLREELERLHREDPDNAPLAYVLADHYRDAGNTEQAEHLYVQLQETAPSLEAYLALIDIYRGEKQVARLLDVLGQVVQRTGNLKPVETAVSSLTDDTEMVDAILAEAQQRMTGQDVSLSTGEAIAAATIALEHRQFELAHQLANEGLGDGPAKQIEKQLNWGLELFLAQRYDAAAVVFRRALQAGLKPKVAALLQFYLAGALELAGKTEEALSAADVAVELDDEAIVYQSRRGWILDHAGRKDQAEVEYARLIERLDPDHGSTQVREVVKDSRSAISNLCVLRGALEEAEPWLEQILDEFPYDPGAMNDLGYLWADQGKHLSRALTMVAGAVQAEPENAAFRDSLGWVLFRLGRYAESVRELEKAADVEDPDGIILEHLGDALAKAGNLPRALDSWERAIQTLEGGDQQQRVSEIRERMKQHRSE